MPVATVRPAEMAAPNAAHAEFPCHTRPASFPVEDGDDVEQVYQRRCPQCGKDWLVTRRTVEVQGIARVDSLIWRWVQTVHGATGTRQKRPK